MARRCAISADTAGLEPATSLASTSLSTRVLYHLRAMRPVILFWLGNLTQCGRTDALLLILNQLFHRWIKIYDRQLGKLLLTLESLSGFVSPGASLLCGFCQLSLLVLVRSTVLGGLKGGLMVGIGPRIEHGYHLFSERKELTYLIALLESTTLRVSSTNKAFIIITLIIKKCNNIPEYFYTSPASRSFSNCSIPL